MKILIVSCVGGHLTELMQLAPLFSRHETVLVVDDEVQLPDFPFVRVYQIAHGQRDWRVLAALTQTAAILAEERPDVIVSAGASPAVAAGLLGKYLGGARFIFIETAAAIRRPTLTGRLVYRFADQFFYQWPSLASFYPRGHLAPLLFP